MHCPKHPATFPWAVLAVLDRLLPADGLVLDPFAGVGTIHALGATLAGRRTVGVELEPEWAAAHPNTLVGDATALPFADDTFDAVATSPAYGNRMADSFVARDSGRRAFYSLALGRRLSPGSGTALQWGEAYRELHARATGEMVRVVKPGGLILVNIKDHRRNHEVVPVTDWWRETLQTAGSRWQRSIPIEAGGLRHLNGHSARPEVVLVHGAGAELDVAFS